MGVKINIKKINFFSKFRRRKTVKPFTPRVEKVRTSKINRRGRKVYQRKFSFIFKIFFKILNFIKESYLFFIFLLIIFFAYLFVKTDIFNVKEITFTGVNQINIEKLESIANDYKGKNIYSVNLDDLEKDVYDSSIYVKSVYAKKYLPSKIVVNIEEREAEFTIEAFDGVFLIDKDGKVIATPIYDSIDFSDEELSILSSNNFDLDIVKLRIIANATDEEINTWKKDDLDEDLKKDDINESNINSVIDFAEIPDEIKLKEYNEIREEINQIIYQHFNSLDNQINDSEFANLQRIRLFKSTNYHNGDYIDANQLLLTKSILRFFNKNWDSYSIQHITWVSDYTVIVDTLESKTFVFGVNRPIAEQLDDLNIMLNELLKQGTDFKKIDLRSKIIAIE